MNIQNLFKIAWRALLLNKTRAMLTMLGIIIGVGSVITMLAIGEGSKKSIKENISKMGTNMLNIRPGAGMMGGVRMSMSDMQSLKMTDYEALKKEGTLLKIRVAGSEWQRTKYSRGQQLAYLYLWCEYRILAHTRMECS